ncbi:MAG: heparinase II/III-family protein [Lachnospiraceae bacterium]|jgi:hypothetical protein|nr:heparinase II/III-family protein [Lachnospiraceae bacterium]MCH4070986.1 heparinase II/III-family protein [Lachnospiraceae bacterium]MCH4107973.1 heparinase II/III-family protein [Lachnospiraceae bacterium]MCI1302441.1 heparinase II/III-family protein [Lachnospiraceae bacterium]MCI1332586.1 heparinase II/III-family protein [Lachnospiraceae bacterium]
MKKEKESAAFHGKCMNTNFSHCAINYTKPIGDLVLPGAGAVAGGRPDFSRLSPELKSKLIRDGEYYLENYTFPPIAPSLYMGYQRTGDRIHFEDVYFTKRMALGSLVLAECVEGSGRFLDKITDGIYSLCEETGWWLPAHNSYSKRLNTETEPAPASALPDPDRPILDLFACETGGILGMVYDLLKKSLAQVDPLVPVRIRETLESRIIRPFLTEYYWWMGDGSREVNNWTTWCVLNVLITCLTIGESQDTKRRVLRQAAESLDYFLDTYAQDGYCSEGAAYYSHAGLNLADDLELLNSVTNGAFQAVSETGFVTNVLLYICRVYAENGWYINYSDCAAYLEGNGLREYAAGKAFGLPQLTGYGLRRFAFMRELDRKRKMADRKEPAILDEADAYGTCERNLYLRLKMLFVFDEADRKAKEGSTKTAESCCAAPSDASGAAASDVPAAADTPDAEDFVFEQAQLMICRTRHFLLAAKGGNNDDSHNHNDVGSIIIYKDGRPLLIDAGVGDYTKKTFSPQRYEIWTMRSSYHNLPDIDGTEQMPGPAAKATDVQMDAVSGRMRMNLREAYPGLEDDFIREVCLDKTAGQITVHDFSGKPHKLVHHFMTWSEPSLAADGHTLRIGDLGTLSWQDARAVQIEKIPIQDRRLLRVWGDAVYRVSIEAETKDSVFVIR